MRFAARISFVNLQPKLERLKLGLHESYRHYSRPNGLYSLAP